MHHAINRVVLQGRAGPPMVHLSPFGPIFASTELRIDEQPDVTVTVSGYGIEATGIAESEPESILRVSGALCFDYASESFYILANQVQRLEEQEGVLVPHAPSTKAFNRFERLFLELEAPSPAQV